MWSLEVVCGLRRLETNALQIVDWRGLWYVSRWRCWAIIAWLWWIKIWECREVWVLWIDFCREFSCSADRQGILLWLIYYGSDYSMINWITGVLVWWMWGLVTGSFHGDSNIKQIGNGVFSRCDVKTVKIASWVEVMKGDSLAPLRKLRYRSWINGSRLNYIVLLWVLIDRRLFVAFSAALELKCLKSYLD